MTDKDFHTALVQLVQSYRSLCISMYRDEGLIAEDLMQLDRELVEEIEALIAKKSSLVN